MCEWDLCIKKISDMLQETSKPIVCSDGSVNKLTVIIPFLNEGNEVENTLNSIRMTVGDKVDIIIINDASTDSYDYLSVAKKYNASYIKNRKRKGVAASRDYGVSLINTPYFLLLDAHMRFYQNDWAELIVEELDKNSQVLLCCDSKVLKRDNTGEINAPEGPQLFGATINFQRDKMMLNSEWSSFEKMPESSVEDIACVLGAGYAASKCYWQYLRGLEGLVHYGSDEAYISLKVWMAGGKCRLLKNIKIGHLYRPQAPYSIESIDTIFNKLWIAELLLPFQYKIRVFGALSYNNPRCFKEAFRLLKKKHKKVNELKEYYSKIFKISFDKILELNKKQYIKSSEQDKERYEELIKNNFIKVLLNCNQLSSYGLWYGRMGCILFLAQYDHLKNNDYYEELIGELIDDLYLKMRSDLNIDLGKGLCGIAYGIAYLLHNGLMEGDINGILEDIDSRIMERSPPRITDYSLETGLAGILYYVLYRLQIAQENYLPLPFDQEYLKHLYKASQGVVSNPEKSESFEMALWFIEYMKNHDLKLEIPTLIEILDLSMLIKSHINLDSGGLVNGFAGLGLSRLN